MKRALGRELALISLPFLAIGGAAWLFAGGGRAVLAPVIPVLDNGPARLEFSTFETVELKPVEVYKGYVWAMESAVKVRGKWDAPPTLKKLGESSPTAQMRLMYRVGNSWKQAKRVGSDGMSVTNQVIGGPKIILRVNLETVPAEAEEIRLRGHFASQLDYKGALATGYKPPSNLKSLGTYHYLVLQSKPFDLVVKAPGQALPNPQVARVPDLEFVAAGWYYQPNIDDIYVRLRTRANLGASRAGSDLGVFDFSMRDGNGKAIDFLVANAPNGAKIKREIRSWRLVDRANYPDLPQNEAIYEVTFGEPAQGWSNVKEPLTIDAIVSNGGWPARVRTTLRRDSKSQNGFPIPR